MGFVTLGWAVRASLCCVLVIVSIIPSLAQIPPGSPAITGPQDIIMGNRVTLTCEVRGGMPLPSVKWLINNEVVDETYTTVGSLTTNEISFTASAQEHYKVYECQSENGVLQNPLSITKFVTVSKTPNMPVLRGPTDVLSGTPSTWTCRSEGAYPAQTMQMRVGITVFTNGFTTQPEFADNLYNLVGTLNWAPTTVNNGNTVYCDVFHPDTLGQNSPQTVSLPLTVRSPLSIFASQTLYSPTTGERVSLQCQVTAGSATQIRWYKNNQLLTLIGNPRYSGSTPSNPSLTVLQVVLTDSGNYICEGTDGSVFKNTSVITVSPQASPSTPVLTGTTSLTAGETGTWKCTSRGGYPEPRMSMRIGTTSLNGLAVQSSFDNNQRYYTVTGNLNWVPNLGHNGMIVYCDVTHPETLASPQTVSQPLTVKSPLSVNAPVTFYNPTEETTVTLNSVVTSGTATQIRWYKNNQLLTVAGRMTGGTVGIPSLTISNVQLSDGGNYVCEGSDGFATPRTNTIVVSVVAKLEVNAPELLYQPTTGNFVTLTCTITSGTPVQIKWYKNSQPIITLNNPRISGGVIGSPSLTISQVRLTDAGLYICQASDNVATRNTSAINLSPKASPSLPVLTGPPSIMSSERGSWVCTSRGAYPEQRLTMRLGNDVFNREFSLDSEQDSNTKTYTLTGTVSWTPTMVNNGQMIYCDVTHPQTLTATQTVSLPVVVKSSPSLPVLTGPPSIMSGERGSWVCTSRGAYPEQRLTMRLGNDVLNREFSLDSEQDSNTKTYILTGTVSWTPTMVNNGQMIYCDVTHPQTLTATQTVSLPVVVKSRLAVSAPKLIYTPMEEEQVTLTCLVTGAQATSVTWLFKRFLNNEQVVNIAANPRYDDGSVDSPSLTISNVQLSDNGEYMCEASDGFVTKRSSAIRLSPREKPATEFVIITKLMKGYNKLVRPIDPAVNMTHSLVPVRMVQFDKRRLVLDAMQCMTWNDPRLSWIKGQGRVSLPSSKIWLPDIVLYGHKFVPDFATKVIVMKDGSVTYCPQGLVTTSDCVEKSGEMYQCTYKFVSWSYDVVMLDKHFPVLNAKVDMRVYQPDVVYEISKTCAVRNEVAFPCRAGTYPQLTYSFIVRRYRKIIIDISQNPSCRT